MFSKILKNKNVIGEQVQSAEIRTVCRGRSPLHSKNVGGQTHAKSVKNLDV